MMTQPEESWTELDGSETSSHILGTPAHCVTEHLGQSLERLFLQVQKESLHSSVVSSSGLNFDCLSPAEPHSPIYIDDHLAADSLLLSDKNDELKKSGLLTYDWIWDWPRTNEHLDRRDGSSGDQSSQSNANNMNVRQWAVRRGIFSKDVLSLLVLTNILSLVIGAGISYSALIRRSL